MVSLLLSSPLKGSVNKHPIYRSVLRTCVCTHKSGSLSFWLNCVFPWQSLNPFCTPGPRAVVLNFPIAATL